MGAPRQTRPFPVVISGPSGAGKTTLVAAMIERDPLLKRSVSTTTRAPREGEREGDAYFFVGREDFEALKKGKLVEWAEVHDECYGTPRGYLEGELAKGQDVVLNIDVQGGALVRKAFPEAVLIFILPPSFGELEERMRRRGTDAAQIEKRMQNARREIQSAADYDYIVINDKLDECVTALGAIVTSERRRRTRFPGDFIDRFGAGEAL